MPSETSERRSPHRKAPGVAPSLTREQIVAEALAMGDEVGIENVSVRKLAARLGKAPMALYTYFSSIDEIRAHVLAQAFTEIDTSPVPGERWDDTLRRTTRSLRQMYLRHERCHLFKVEGGGYSTGLEAHTRRVYALHEAQGIPEDVLRRLWRVVDAFLGGFVVAEAAERESLAERPDPAGQAWLETTERAYTAESFADGVEVIIAGTRALAAPDPCEWRTPA